MEAIRGEERREEEGEEGEEGEGRKGGAGMWRMRLRCARPIPTMTTLSSRAKCPGVRTVEGLRYAERKGGREGGREGGSASWCVCGAWM